MQITTENIQDIVTENGNLILVRCIDQGNVHVGRTNTGEIIDYASYVHVAKTPDEVVQYLDDVLRSTDVATVHHYPFRGGYQIRTGVSL